MSQVLEERRIGAYGGTFDPIHNGHIAVARAVVESFRLDTLLVIPSARPPHKTSRQVSDSYHRYAMAVLATLELPRVIVSTMEIETPDLPYTFQTVERLRSQFGGGARLFFVMGADSFDEIETWRNPDRILASCNLIVAARPGWEIDKSGLNRLAAKLGGSDANIVDMIGQTAASVSLSAQTLNGSIYVTDFVRAEVSSTTIRQLVEAGRPVAGLVPPVVVNYIDKYQLYR